MTYLDHLNAWVRAGVLDAETAARIREFEASRPDARRVKWPVILALAFGGILMAAGLLLFVASHWDDLSPVGRIGIVIGALAGLHVAGALTTKFPALAATLHAVGTVGLGGAIAVSGQVFNMDEHWPSAILLWAVGAWMGLSFLRDTPHVILAAVLTPAWIASEAANRSPNAGPWIAAFVTLTALVYMSARGTHAKAHWRSGLAVAGAIALIPAASTTFAWFWSRGSSGDFLDRAWLLLLPLPAAYCLRRREAWPALVWAGWLFLQVLAASQSMRLTSHLSAGLAAVALTVWGVWELRKERINLGVASFVLATLWFYFSYFIDSLNRSLGLIVLGVLFLVGGWQLERLRRRLMRNVEKEAQL